MGVFGGETTSGSENEEAPSFSVRPGGKNYGSTGAEGRTGKRGKKKNRDLSAPAGGGCCTDVVCCVFFLVYSVGEAVPLPEDEPREPSNVARPLEKVVEKCPRWEPGPGMRTQQVLRRKRDPSDPSKLIDLPKRYLPVDFASRYVPTLRRCVRYKLQPPRYCLPRDNMCFALTDDGGTTGNGNSGVLLGSEQYQAYQAERVRRNAGINFRGCCPDKVAATYPGLTQAERLFLENDVQCYYGDAYGQYLPFAAAARESLLQDYSGTIADSRKSPSRNNHIMQVLWLVNNRQQIDYEYRFLEEKQRRAGIVVQPRAGGAGGRGGEQAGSPMAVPLAGNYNDAEVPGRSPAAANNGTATGSSAITWRWVHNGTALVQEFGTNMADLIPSGLVRIMPHEEVPTERPVLAKTDVDYWARTETVASARFTKALRQKFCASEYTDDAPQADPENQVTELFSRWGFQIYDLLRFEWPLLLLLGVFGPIVLGSACIWLIPYCIRVLTWLIYVVAFAVVLLGNFVLLVKAGWLPAFLLNELDDQDPCDGLPPALLYNAQEASYWQKWSVVGLISGFVLLLLLVLLKKRIDFGLKLLQTTGKVILEMPGILWFGFLGIFLTIALLGSLGYPLWLAWGTSTDEIKGYAFVHQVCGDSVAKEILGEDITDCANALNWTGFVFLLFGFFWTLFFCGAVLETCTAMCVCKWYFERHDPKSMFYDLEHDRACFRTLCLLGVVLGKHTGTCAFGSFLLAICWTLQVVAALIRWARQKAKRAVSSPTEAMLGLDLSSRSSTSGCCSLERLLLAVNWAIMYICGQAFIFVAIEGKGFCRSAVRVTKLMIAHPAQCGTNLFLTRLVSGILLIIVPAAVALLAFVVNNFGGMNAMKAGCNAQNAANIAGGAYEQFLLFGEEGFSLPLLCFLVAFFLMFTLCKTYATAVDALYICIYRDMDKFDGKYLQNSPELAKLMDAKGVAAAEDEEE
eukprot:g6591.t1